MKSLLLVLVCLVVFYNGRTFGKFPSKCLLLDDQYMVRINTNITSEIGKVTYQMISPLLPCLTGPPSTCNETLRGLPDLKWTTMNQWESKIYSVYAFYAYIASIGRKLSVYSTNKTIPWSNYTLHKDEKNFIEQVTEKITPKELNVPEKSPVAESEEFTGFKIQTFIINPAEKQMNQANTTVTINVKVEASCAEIIIFATNTFNKTCSAYYTYEAKDYSPGWIRSPASDTLYLTLVSNETNFQSPNCSKARYEIIINPTNDENRTPNPCRNVDTNNETRFEYPESSSKYIECKVSGQMEVVTCPTNYTASQRGCGEQILFNNTVLYTGVSPCTTQAKRNGIYYSANPSNKTSFIQCTEYGVAFLMYCSTNTYWSQYSNACVDVYTDRSSGVNPYNFFQAYIYIYIFFCLFIQKNI